MDGLKILVVIGVNARGRDQVSALQNRMHVLVLRIASAAEGTTVPRHVCGGRQQRAHIEAQEFGRAHANEICQRAVYPEHVVGFVMDNDEVRDRVKNFHPVPVCLIHTREQAGILQGHGRVSGNRLQQLMIFVAQRLAPIGQAKYADGIPGSPE